MLLGEHSIAARSIPELSEYDRRMAEFNRKRPLTKPPIGGRITSWSDPRTARGLFDEEFERKIVAAGTGTGAGAGLSSSPLGKTDSASTDDSPFGLFTSETEGIGEIRRRRLRGRRSFDDAEKLRKTIRILPMDRMRIDVELCGQLLIMTRREIHLANIIACLKALTSSLSSTNENLQRDFANHQAQLVELEAQTEVLQQIESARYKVEGMTQDTNALAYESAQFLVDDLWHMASQPRQKVLDIRGKVFGTGRRLAQGVHGAHGQFNRIQWRVDGSEVLVDAWGRTESEAEEEDGLPGGHPLVLEDEEGEVVEHQGLRPTWLLRLFTSWGSRWGAKVAAKGLEILPNAKSSEASSGNSSRERGESTGGEKQGVQEEGMSSSVEGSSSRDTQGEGLRRTRTAEKI